MCHSYEISFNGPFVYCGDFEEYKGGRGVRRRGGGGGRSGGESWQDCENLESKQTLYVWGVLFIILGGRSYPLQTLNCEQGPLLALDSLQTAL